VASALRAQPPWLVVVVRRPWLVVFVRFTAEFAVLGRQQIRNGAGIAVALATHGAPGHIIEIFCTCAGLAEASAAVRSRTLKILYLALTIQAQKLGAAVTIRRTAETVPESTTVRVASRTSAAIDQIVRPGWREEAGIAHVVASHHSAVKKARLAQGDATVSTASAFMAKQPGAHVCSALLDGTHVRKT